MTLFKFHFYNQLDKMDCGPACLRMVAKYYGRYFSAQYLRERTEVGKGGVSLLGMAKAAESIGFHTLGIKVDINHLIDDVPLPCILHWNKNHYVVLFRIESRGFSVKQKLLRYFNLINKVNTSKQLNSEFLLESEIRINTKYRFHIADPALGKVSYSLTEFKQLWGIEKDREGIVLIIEPNSRLYEEDEERIEGVHFTQFFNYVWKFKKLLVQLALGMGIGSIIQLLFPFLTQSVVDIGINTQNLPFIYLVLIAQLALTLGQSATGFLRSWILLHISVRLNLTILSDFLSKLMKLPVSFFDSKQFGDIMQRIGDHQRIESFLTGQVLTLVFSLFNLVLFALVLAWYNLPIFIVIISGSIIYALWIVLFLGKRRKLDFKRFNIAASNHNKLLQLIHGMQDIKLGGAELSKRWEWERIQGQLFKWNIRELSLSQIQEAGALLINEGKNVIITFLSAKAVLDGQLSLGGMLSVQYIIGQFNSPIQQFIGLIRSWQDAKLSMERLNEVHNLPNEDNYDNLTRLDWPIDHNILIENLSFAYPGIENDNILNNVNIVIPSGKTTAIVGTSGSGKTTLLKLLLRFYDIKNGSISLSRIQNGNVSNIPINSISHSKWREQCGVVMQEGYIFSDSIARNISVSDEIVDHKKLFHAAKVANIHSFIDSLPLGYNTKIGAEGMGISQGQKQRILIARAVYKNPKILIFDEATNSLDSSNESQILQNLGNFLQGRTVIVVAHRLSTIKNADQIIVLENGRVIEQGTHESLLDLKGKYYQLVINQLNNIPINYN